MSERNHPSDVPTFAEQLTDASAQRLVEARSLAIGLARELARLGVENLLAESEQDGAESRRSCIRYEQRWLAMGACMRDFEKCRGSALRDHDRALRDYLLGRLGLGRVGMWLVLLVLAAELHPDVAASFSLLAEDERVQLPTPTSVAGLLASALELSAHETLRECMAEGAARRLGLLEAIEIVPGRPLAQQGLRMVERELELLLSLGRGDEILSAACEREEPTLQLVYPRLEVVGMAALLQERGLICLRCSMAASARQLALDLASLDRRDLALFHVVEQLPSLGELAQVDRAVRAIDLHAWPEQGALPISRLREFAATLGELVVLVREGSVTGKLTTIDVPPLGAHESQRVWSSLGLDEGRARDLGDRFRVGVAQARAAAREASDRLVFTGLERVPTIAELSAAVRSQGARRMGRMVTTLRSPARLDRLIVPGPIVEQLRDIVAWQRASASVERELGPGTLGRGLTCLFSGPPGTGKTFAAQCIANELELNLYRIDLSQVVSKWLGETEKALAQVFDEAEAGHGVLLFDEADALFGRRTEVKDAHDRYANVEVGYLLQRMESFAGVAILTTNLRGNIDDAFIRRLRFVIEFPTPDAEQRASLWAQALSASRTAELDLAPFVARFRLTGGHIHNIALAAIHLAAAAGVPIGPRELTRATYRELEKAGFARSPAEFGPLASWLSAGGSASAEVAS